MVRYLKESEFSRDIDNERLVDDADFYLDTTISFSTEVRNNAIKLRKKLFSEPKMSSKGVENLKKAQRLIAECLTILKETTITSN